MKYRHVGSSGLSVSEVGLGCNNFGRRLDERATRRVIEAAVGAGITFFDTADVYGKGESERLIGRYLGPLRKDVVLATKFGSAMSDSPLERGASRRWLTRSVEASLGRLGTDYVDLIQVHFPDPSTPIEETVRALDDLVRAGKVRYFGFSNFSAWQVLDAHWTARHLGLNLPVSSQEHYNLLQRSVEGELIPALRRCQMGLIPYYPLESGFLTGKYEAGNVPPGTRLALNRGASERLLTAVNFERLGRLREFAAERHLSLVQLAFAWLLGRPEVASVIAGASSPEQVQENVAASLVGLSPEDFTALHSL